MEVLFAFSFDGGFIFETKNTSLPESAPKHEKFQWKLVTVPNSDTNFVHPNITSDNVSILEFMSRTETTRTFKNGIYLDLDNLIMKHGGQSYELTDVRGSPIIDSMVR